MINRGADRNLLFGVLALQLQFVTADDLIGAMYEWVRDKDQSLGQILVRSKALAEDAQRLLEALVQRHVAIHDGNAAQGLMSLYSAPSIPAPLHQLADADVQASLLKLRATAETGTSGGTANSADASSPTTKAPTAGPMVGASTSSGLRFRLLRAHAKGGLGQVSVALDEELRREVAIKEMQERYADDPESRARFLLEAEVTGRLEHPGIVPVYGLGRREDGRPFYVMRFIRGDTLTAAIKQFHRPEGAAGTGQHSLEFRRLLRRFLDACDAIAYAHSRGVLHRDIKPGNIMLGEYGETLVVDWGLAKVVGRPETDEGGNEPTMPALATSAQTAAGRALGTPAYMSPEQAGGRLEQIAPTTDIYSLGATLYCLLTGIAPFEGEGMVSLLRKVQQGDFPKPSQLNPTISPPLEAICLKAMAPRPEQRYQSVTELSEDIENWLADKPVSIWPAQTIVEANQLSKSFRDLSVSDLTFKVARGAVFALLGAEGSGKSTALGMLSGLVRPDKGRAAILGQDCWRQAGPLRRHVGCVSERPHFFGWMSISDIGWFVAGFSGPEFPGRFGALVESSGLSPSARVRSLTREQRYHLAYLLALGRDPEVLLLDEPPEHLLAVLKQDRLAGPDRDLRSGRTILLASGRFDAVESLATHVAFLHRGRLLVAAPLDELRKRIIKVRLRFDREPPDAGKLGTPLSVKCVADHWHSVIQHPDQQALARLYTTPGWSAVEVSPLSLQELYEAFVTRGVLP
jgi:serine/threonine protein kinase